MAEIWIFNASPIIVLAKAGLLNVLDSLCSTCMVPDAVATEVLRGPKGDALEPWAFRSWALSVYFSLLNEKGASLLSAMLSPCCGQMECLWMRS